MILWISVEDWVQLKVKVSFQGPKPINKYSQKEEKVSEIIFFNLK